MEQNESDNPRFVYYADTVLVLLACRLQHLQVETIQILRSSYS